MPMGFLNDGRLIHGGPPVPEPYFKEGPQFILAF